MGAVTLLKRNLIKKLLPVRRIQKKKHIFFHFENFFPNK